MTIEELHIDFKIKFDKIDSLQKKDFTDAEIDWLLNEAQEQFLRQHYKPINLSRKGFEANQDRIDMLSTLHVKYAEEGIVTPIKVEESIYEINLSKLKNKYLHLTNLEVDFGCGYTKTKHTTNDTFSESLINPFNKKEVLYNFGRSSNSLNSSIYIYKENVAKAKVEYIKQPKKVNSGTYEYFDTTLTKQSLEFPEFTHPMIVDLAVLEATRIIANNNQEKININD